MFGGGCLNGRPDRVRRTDVCGPGHGVGSGSCGLPWLPCARETHGGSCGPGCLAEMCASYLVSLAGPSALQNAFLSIREHTTSSKAISLWWSTGEVNSELLGLAVKICESEVDSTPACGPTSLKHFKDRTAVLRLPRPISRVRDRYGAFATRTCPSPVTKQSALSMAREAPIPIGLFRASLSAKRDTERR